METASRRLAGVKAMGLEWTFAAAVGAGAGAFALEKAASGGPWSGGMGVAGLVAIAAALAALMQGLTERLEVHRGRRGRCEVVRAGLLFRRAVAFKHGTLDAVCLVLVNGDAGARAYWRLEVRGGPGAYRVLARNQDEAPLAELGRALAEALGVPFEVER